MKNLKLLATIIFAGLLLASSSQANKIEGVYINLGSGSARFIGVNWKCVEKIYTTIAVVFGIEYVYNYKCIIASVDLDYRFIDSDAIKYLGKSVALVALMTHYGLGAHQFLGRLNLGYELTDGFAVFTNVGMTAQGANKSEKLVEGKKFLSNVGFVWGFGARYVLNKNWSVRGDLGFNSVSITKDLKDLKNEDGDKIMIRNIKSLDYRTTTFTVSYNF